MQVIATHASDTSALVSLRYDFDGSDKGYPFLLRVDITYTLDTEGFSFVVTATNRNADGWPLPFYNGACLRRGRTKLHAFFCDSFCIDARWETG